MASSSFVIKLSRSFSRITMSRNTGLSARSITTSRVFSTYQLSDKESEDDLQLVDTPNNEETKKQPYSGFEQNNSFRPNEKPLPNGSDAGIYKAILLGEVGQLPVQKRLRSGRVVTMFSVGTGGIRNNRRPLENETPREFADRSAIQWHRVAIYLDNLGGIAMQHIKQGAHVYLEGNLETKVFSDPVTGLVKRIREIAIRRGETFIFDHWERLRSLRDFSLSEGCCSQVSQDSFSGLRSAGWCIVFDVIWLMWLLFAIPCILSNQRHWEKRKLCIAFDFRNFYVS